MPDTNPTATTQTAGSQVASHLAGQVLSLTVLMLLLVGYVVARNWGTPLLGAGLVLTGFAVIYGLFLWLTMQSTLLRAYNQLPVQDDLRLSRSSASRRKGVLQGTAIGALVLALFVGLTELAVFRPPIVLVALPTGSTIAIFLEYCDLIRWQRSRNLRLCRRRGGRRFLVSRVPSSETHVLVRA